MSLDETPSVRSLRILFVCGATGGGALMSTRQLGEELARRGHSVAFLEQQLRVACRRRRYTHSILRKVATRVRFLALDRMVLAVASHIGSRPVARTRLAFAQCWSAAVVQNAVRSVAKQFGPDVAVVASVDAAGWERTHAILDRLGVATVRYIREESSAKTLAGSSLPDKMLANSRALVAQCAERGREAQFVPSIVQLADCMVSSTRETVLFVNPVEISGLDVVIAVAAARPDLHFVFQESWVFPGEIDALRARVRHLPNVEVRAFSDDPASVYRDARVLLLPYRTNGRPRVVLEAQINAIPVIGSDRPSMAEAIGAGGVILPDDAPTAEWSAALDLVANDYEALSSRALDHARREEVSVPRIVATFESAVRDALVARNNPARSGGADTGRPAGGVGADISASTSNG